MLAFKIKRLGYPFDCFIDIILCFSLFRSDFVEGILSARSINDLTAARSSLVHTGMMLSYLSHHPSMHKRAAVAV